MGVKDRIQSGGMIYTATLTAGGDAEYQLAVTEPTGREVDAERFDRAEDPDEALADLGWARSGGWTETAGRLAAPVESIS